MKPLALFFSQGANRVARAAATAFARGNAESTPFPCQSFDLVTIVHAFHEASRGFKAGHDRIHCGAHRLLGPGGALAVTDICSEHKPLKTMLAGEPRSNRN